MTFAKDMLILMVCLCIQSSKSLTVQGDSSDPTIDSELQRLCFITQTQGKTKRSAFQLSNQRFTHLQRYLIFKGAIPLQRSLTITKADFRLIRVRKSWSLMKTVCFVIESRQQRLYERFLYKLGVHKWMREQLPSKMNDRDLANKAFISAKLRAVGMLQGTGIRLVGVKRVQEIGTEGRGNRLEDQLGYFFNQSIYEADVSTEEEESSEAPSEEDRRINQLQQEHESHTITMRVTFKIKAAQQDLSSTTEQL